MDVSRFQHSLSSDLKQPAASQAALQARRLAAPQQPAPLIAGGPNVAVEALGAWRQGEKRPDARVRWCLSKMPLTVCCEGFSVEQAAAVFALIAQWEQASMGLREACQPAIRFRHSGEDAANAADIVLRWERETVLGRDYEVGHTRREVRDGVIHHAEIVLIESPVIDGYLGDRQKAARVAATILHEFGHALGLEHADNRADVMYYRGWQNQYVTAGDVAALAELYATGTRLEA